MIEYNDLPSYTQKLVDVIVRKRFVSRDSVLQYYETILNSKLREMAPPETYYRICYLQLCTDYNIFPKKIKYENLPPSTKELVDTIVEERNILIEQVVQRYSENLASAMEDEMIDIMIGSYFAHEQLKSNFYFKHPDLFPISKRGSETK